MATMPDDPIVVLGGGPAGMAAALALHTVGQPVVILERYREARPAGNILNLWPPPLKALREIGVDTTDIGAPNHTTFQNAHGHVRADVQIPQHVLDEYGGGFIGLLRPDLYRRMLAALPEGMLRTGQEVLGIEDRGADVLLTLRSGETVRTPLLIGADGIDSIVRTHLWGPSPKRDHRLHIIGGYTFATVPEATWGELPLIHTRTVQGTYSSIRSEGRNGYQWWVLEAWDPATPPPEDLLGHARGLAAAFPGALPALVAATEPEHVQRWPIRDRVPLKRWSNGRITLAGDAAHATSPYAAYGAGMSISDGYFLAQRLAGVDLADTAAVVAALRAYETPRIPHTTSQVQQAYVLGRVFHHAPAPLRPIRDYVLDHTPFLQKQVGERSPGEIIDQLAEMGRDIRTPA
ncbi:MAG TPA: NAD(P)/FAD-dependent oxidoreductase [Amnibacterium sp.]|jgi:2-polyprenyl-6-methoxyphenol hydroxylase-like FAD-dependent oxidoreductase|uniref:FAD-dependent oxidoreductase n=1 Tax=Amnibacterium sp. TaxID=1872496 RepID=UPI002F91EBD7